MSNHPTRDGALDNLGRLAERGPDDPHPFVAGNEALGAFDLLRDCSLAQAESIKAGDRTPKP